MKSAKYFNILHLIVYKKTYTKIKIKILVKGVLYNIIQVNDEKSNNYIKNDKFMQFELYILL